MLFAKRDLKDASGRSLSQRFADQVGRYLTAPNDNQSRLPMPIEIPACFALLGENTDNVDYDLESLRQSTQQIINDYHQKTERWLSHEQVSLAAIWQDTKRQVTTLQERSKPQPISSTILNHSHPSSLFRLALLADALHIKHINASGGLTEPVKPHACSRTLNLPLDETSMTELEGIGREIRQECEKSYTKQGVDLEGMQTCWRLKLRYQNCNNVLTLKCMPIEMLREVFEAEHLQKFGMADENQAVIIDELVIEVCIADASSPNTPKTSVYTEQWTSQWQPAEGNQTGHWLKQNNPLIQHQFSWLYCPILEDLLANFVTNQPDSTMPDFFLTNHQKDVDEVVIRN